MLRPPPARAVLLGALALVACNRDNKVQVECQAAGDAFRCSVEHVEGRDRVEACWDVNVRCRNGWTMEQTGCQTVAPQSKASLVMPLETFAGLSGCDRALSVHVENIKIKPAR